MISPSYLVVRNGWYHLRIRIPQDISEYFPRQEVWESLKTRDASHAAIIAQRYLSAFKEISALMWSGMIERENISEIISEEIRNLLFSREVAREMNYDWMPEVNLADLAITKLEVCKDALITRDYTKIEAEVMRIFASREIERTPKTVEFNIAARQYLHAMIEACKIEIHRSQGNQGLYETTSLSSFQT